HRPAERTGPRDSLHRRTRRHRPGHTSCQAELMTSHPTLDGFACRVALAVARTTEAPRLGGDAEHVYPRKPVTKPRAALAARVAIDQGKVSRDEPAGPEGATVRHLLAHASGLPFDEGPTQSPQRRRVYSNLGFEQLGEHVAQAVGTSFAGWTCAVVIDPLE